MKPSVFDMLDDLEQASRGPRSGQWPYAVGYRRSPSNTRREIEPQYDDFGPIDAGENTEVHYDAFGSFGHLSQWCATHSHLPDKELMRRPIEDRQAQAEQGRARLSLAPQSSRYFSDGEFQPTQTPPRPERDTRAGW
jgi:ATP-dependent DNA helicase HFM1/MER3